MNVSVALCTYNGERFLQAQLDSLLAQTRRPDELIICDDLSTDASLAIIREFSSTAGFPVRLFQNSQNLGIVRNFENAIRHCASDLIFLCDQDDVWYPQKIEAMCSVFESAAEVGLVFTDAELVDDSLNPLGKQLFAELEFNGRRKKLVKKGMAFDLLLRNTFITGATMAFRSKLKELVLPLPTPAPLIHDGWMSLMIAAISKVEFIDQPLINYRQHSNQFIGALWAGKLEGARNLLRDNSEWYLAQASQLGEAVERLVAYGLSAQNERLLREKISHLHERARMPRRQLKRLRSVVRETASWRYHRFSDGWFSAAKDLLA
jgi:glycosyltransferase involved in cell wall biosynthesis